MSTAGRTEPDQSARDEELAAAKGGDSAARWRALEACRDYLRLVVRRGRLSEAAGVQSTSDLVQGTFVDAWRQFSKFRGGSPVQLRAWLKAILIHAAYNARRRTGLAQFGSWRTARVAPASTSSPSQAAQRKSAGEALDAALEALSERHRAVIHLRLWDRLSFVEIGARMDLSEDAARMLYGRALAKLRECMRPGHDPG
jgi:RNA polymerase sigma-70 factor (ECF subfamily)